MPLTRWKSSTGGPVASISMQSSLHHLISPFEQYSMTRYILRDFKSSRTSISFTTCLWWSFFMIAISFLILSFSVILRRKSLGSSFAFFSCLSTILMATSWPVTRSLASLTLPCWPWPSSLMISYVLSTLRLEMGSYVRDMRLVSLTGRTAALPELPAGFCDGMMWSWCSGWFSWRMRCFSSSMLRDSMDDDESSERRSEERLSTCSSVRLTASCDLTESELSRRCAVLYCSCGVGVGVGAMLSGVSLMSMDELSSFCSVRGISSSSESACVVIAANVRCVPVYLFICVSLPCISSLYLLPVSACVSSPVCVSVYPCPVYIYLPCIYLKHFIQYQAGATNRCNCRQLLWSRLHC